ncbi:type I restriction-modification system subunit M [Iocasia frigidifontis]|uniref:site-specific DNA-methyltransferase (adenine-specific) n=1 Tax=Iocasia fonsfrigidae TaxID=2682810 RepID=A0A8A7K6R1_9FIRM|nr:type I restriction-modification system subunit M [Iocasia fonsfrigidae]QTL97473.1 type I restriction-modification system subunit M [Iocasia fonsfrigidae]
MNKQELAAKIWETANELRGSMEASEYKDYILGFIFYKYLSEKEVNFLLGKGFEKEDIEDLKENDDEDVNWISNNLGYFIEPKHLFQTWIKSGSDFTVDNVRTALSAFNRNINPNKKKIFGGVLNTLEQGLSKLGDTATSQTKAIRQLVSLVNDVPTNNRKYDTLGYIYEYLISQFAAGAGKKAGEFYTPHEVSLVMAEIVAEHLKDQETIQIYDPTSGSGSLLLNIGQAISKYIDNPNKIKYYAQEKIHSTYNLTRMNLVMHEVLPDNMVIRNGDTLERDFPYFEDSDPEGTYEPIFVDAVVSNPPYSQRWDPADKGHDPRFSSYGLAPKSKADYAFLLHSLYHLKREGILTIILPHGVLFRGGEEENIRKKLIDNIDAIIGLPPNIFFGTGIPTIIMVLKKKKGNDNILFIDASKGFKKHGSKNVLQSSDIKRIVDTVIERENVEKYARLVFIDDIIKNEYNLNITRYISSDEDDEEWDVYATMLGGIPKTELKKYSNIWGAMPNLYNDLFDEKNQKYVELKSGNVRDLIKNSRDSNEFKSKFNSKFSDYSDFLSEQLIENAMDIKLAIKKEVLVKDLFNRFKTIPLIDRYIAYQIFDDTWKIIANDLESMQQESFDALRAVDPNMVMKTKKGKKVEEQDGWKGRIIPFEVVQNSILKEEKNEVDRLESRQMDIQEELTNIINTLSEEEGEYSVLNDKNDKFLINDTKAALNELFEEIETPELNALNKYNELYSNESTSVLLEFINNHNEINWDSMRKKKDGTPYINELRDYILTLQKNYEFPEDSFGAKLSAAVSLIDEEKQVKKDFKEKTNGLHMLTKKTIEELTDEEAKDMLKLKWIEPLVNSLLELPNKLIDDIAESLSNLNKKYEDTLIDIEDKIDSSSRKLNTYLNELTGSEFDIKGLSEFKKLLSGDNDGR